MESSKKSWSIKVVDPNLKINEGMHDTKFMGIKELPVCMMIIGQSNSGKTTLLVNLLIKKLIWEYPPENIYFFSKTIIGDKTYRPVLRYLASTDQAMNIYKSVDFNVINKIVEEQEDEQITEMARIDASESDYVESDADDLEVKPKPKTPKKFLFIFDDILSDRQFKSHSS